MEIVNLCKNGCCPRVEVYDDKVMIGEEGNYCTLDKKQWGSLVKKIKEGILQ